MELILYPIDIALEDAYDIYLQTGQYFIIKNNKIYIGVEESNEKTSINN